MLRSLCAHGTARPPMSAAVGQAASSSNEHGTTLVRSELKFAQESKASALAAEDFEAAKLCKEVEAALEPLVSRESELLRLRVEAVWVQDFDGASAIQHQLKSIEEQAIQHGRQLKGGAPPEDPSSATKTKAGGKGGKGDKAGDKGKKQAPAKSTKQQEEEEKRKQAEEEAAIRRMQQTTQQRAHAANLIVGVYKAHYRRERRKEEEAVRQKAVHIAYALRWRFLVCVRIRKRVERRKEEEAAAVRIETVARGKHAGRRRRELRLRSLSMLHAMARRWLLHQERLRRRAAAAVLISYLRDLKAAKSYWAQLKLDRSHAALSVHKIQQAARRRNAVNELGRRRDRRDLREASAIRIQAAARTRPAREQTEQLRQARRDNNHAADMVRLFLRNIAMTQDMHIRMSEIAEMLHRGAAVIQAATRMRQTQKILGIANAAATKIANLARRKQDFVLGVWMQRVRATNILHSFLDSCAKKQALRRRMEAIVTAAKARELERRLASEKIQAAGRGMAGRRRSVHQRKLIKAATLFQAGLRGMIGRRKHYDARLLRAVLQWQRNFRGYQGRRMMNVLRDRLRREKSAILLQAGARGMAARRRSSIVRQKAVAIKLQNAWRGRVGRRRVWRLFESIREAKATVMITRYMIGWIVRVRMRLEAAKAKITPPIEIVMLLRCAPIAYDAREFAAHLIRLLRQNSEPPIRLTRHRLTARIVGGDGDGGDSDDVELQNAIVVIVSVLPGLVPGDVSAFDAAAGLLRIPIATISLAIGATVAAPLTASLMAQQPQPIEDDISTILDTLSTAVGGGQAGEDPERKISVAVAGLASSEARGRMRPTSSSSTWPRRTRPPLAAAVLRSSPGWVLLSLIREALHAAELGAAEG